MPPASKTPETLLRLLASGSLLFLAACASPGPPRPPSLHLPTPPGDLTAQRIGDSVHLRWTTPPETTDRLPLHGTVTAVLCRALPPSTSPEICQPVQRRRVQLGPFELIDPLPPSLTQGAAQLLLYRVQLFNGSEHAAMPSAPAYAASGAGPQAVDGLRAESADGGALLRWHPADDADPVEVHRTAPDSKAPEEVLLLATVPCSSLQSATGAGGTFDSTAQPGIRYLYTAERLRSLTLAGHTLELHSIRGTPVPLDVRDTFPPHAPKALEAIADTTVPGNLAVDLSWRPNTEPDLAGYLVFRQERELTPNPAPQQLTPTPLTAPGFRDPAVSAARSYSYTVLAVDTTGNRSGPSDPAIVRLP